MHARRVKDVASGEEIIVLMRVVAVIKASMRLAGAGVLEKVSARVMDVYLRRTSRARAMANGVVVMPLLGVVSAGAQANPCPRVSTEGVFPCPEDLVVMPLYRVPTVN